MNITHGRRFPRMSSVKPYLIKPLYQWINDNQLIPYLVVDATVSRVQVPLKFVQDDGKIILDISSKATSNLMFNTDSLEFEAKFQGKQEFISVPFSAVIALYAQENGKGLVFDEDDVLSASNSELEKDKMTVKSTNKVRGHLRLVSETVVE